jgi:hypothetical protein
MRPLDAAIAAYVAEVMAVSIAGARRCVSS